MKLKVSTNNEYGQLKSVLLGSAENMTWPEKDIEFDKNIQLSTYKGTLTKGMLPTTVIKEANEDLDKFSKTMTDRGIRVLRPNTNGPNWAYSARDVLLTIGDTVIACPTPFTSRANELDLYPDLQHADCNIVIAPRPQSNKDPMFDAANVLKINDKLVYSLSHSANEAGAEWLQQQVGTAYEVITWQVVSHQITHIDSTILSCGPDIVLVNASRVKQDQLPKFMNNFKKIWVTDILPRKFETFPYSSKWIGMNVLSLDPETIVVDDIQKKLIAQLKEEKFNVISLPMRHARTLGGGFHCVTCDLERD